MGNNENFIILIWNLVFYHYIFNQEHRPKMESLKNHFWIRSCTISVEFYETLTRILIVPKSQIFIKITYIAFLFTYLKKIGKRDQFFRCVFFPIEKRKVNEYFSLDMTQLRRVAGIYTFSQILRTADFIFITSIFPDAEDGGTKRQFRNTIFLSLILGNRVISFQMLRLHCPLYPYFVYVSNYQSD